LSIAKVRVPTTVKAYVYLHVAVLLFGFTAILGDLIDMAALPIVWWRLLITSVSLIFIINWVRLRKELTGRQIMIFAGIGVVVGLHWLSFYGSIKLANASVTLICMATTSFFTALLEPRIVNRKFDPYELILGLLIIPGMVLIVSDLDPSMYWGVPVGLASALLAALFSILNKKYVGTGEVLRITFIELTAAFLFLSLLLPFFWQGEGWTFIVPDFRDAMYLLVLGLLCTSVAFSLVLEALKVVSAFVSSLSINLEPVYGIVLAYFILGDNEDVSHSFYIGAVIILAAVLGHPVLQRYQRKRKKDEQRIRGDT
jgi:drug/metabolite transporter (DMT)-like permease